MSSTPDVRRRLPPVEALHVLTLTTFAVAQPLFDLLGRNASFFVAHRASRADVIVFSVATVLVPAALLLLARYLISFASREAAHVFHLVCLTLLGALALTPPVVRALGIRWLPALALAIAVGVGVLHLYRRFGGFRRFLSLLGLSVLVFPALFLFASPVRDLILPTRSPPARLASANVRAASDTPVFVVLFDELSISSIITPDGTIDDERYPNFARFVDRSTWYREATTSGLRTDQAVPAILTGRRVPRRQVPSSYAYPDNLFTLLSRTHDLHVHESVTQLCPPKLCGGADDEQVSGLGALFGDAAVVYGHLALPADVAATRLPPLGDRWAGFSRDPGAGAADLADLGGGDPVRAWLRSALLAQKEQHEGEMLERFLDGIQQEGDRPQLSWVHVQIPHPPWRYLPTGQVYPTGDSTPGYRNFTWSKNQYLADEVLQRSLLQTRYADELMGMIERRLTKTGVWDEAMVVVLSDHGATWEAGNSRRDVDGPHRASLLGVPLFIKYPGQDDGTIDDRNAETVDVLPTIADVAGIPLGWQTHGSSLIADDVRDAKVVFDGTHQRRVRYSFRESMRRAREIAQLFGRGGGRDDLYGFGPDRELIGTPVRMSSTAPPSEVRMRVFDEGAYENVPRDAAVVPAFFRAALIGDVADGRRAVVALNGTIAGVGRTFTENGRSQLAMMLSPRYLRERGDNSLEVFLIDDDERLRRVDG